MLGEGMDDLVNNPNVDWVESDVSFGDRTMLIADGHSLPFRDGFFDAVICQAVLEHVLDPHRVVSEIHRVLKDDGLVYAETAFMAQVHGGKYDFTRFTHLGHRRLFRHFEEIESGACCGPGTALAWSWRYFLLSFTSSRAVRGALRIASALSAFPLKYFDEFLVDKPSALDGAMGLFFLGRKSDEVLSDRQLLGSYRSRG